jgi:PPP family 3-phenylpropionic acid transporter
MRGTAALRIYYIASFAVSGVYLPFFPRWLEARGIFGLRLGVICAAAPAMALVAPTAFGVVADGLGLRVGLLQVACGGALVAFGSLAAVVAFGFPLGFGGLLFAALGIATFRSPMALMGDVVALDRAPELGTTYGRLRLWGSLGFLGATLLAGLWVDPREALPLPVVCSGALFAGFASSLALPRRTELPARVARHGVGRLLMEGDFRLFLGSMFLGQCGHVAYDMCFSIHLLDLGIPRALVGVAWALGTGAEVLLMAWSAPAFAAFPVATLLAFGLAIASMRWVALAVVRSPLLILLLQPLHALSFGLVWLAAVSYAARRFPSHSLATAQGLFGTAVGAGSIVGMLIWGFVYERAGGRAIFAGAACFSACAFACAVALAKKTRGPSRPGDVHHPAQSPESRLGLPKDGRRGE